jgi:hypothetical protein
MKARRMDPNTELLRERARVALFTWPKSYTPYPRVYWSWCWCGWRPVRPSGELPPLLFSSEVCILGYWGLLLSCTEKHIAENPKELEKWQRSPKEYYYDSALVGGLHPRILEGPGDGEWEVKEFHGFLHHQFRKRLVYDMVLFPAVREFVEKHRDEVVGPWVRRSFHDYPPWEWEEIPFWPGQALLAIWQRFVDPNATMETMRTEFEHRRVQVRGQWKFAIEERLFEEEPRDWVDDAMDALVAEDEQRRLHEKEEGMKDGA